MECIPLQNGVWRVQIPRMLVHSILSRHSSSSSYMEGEDHTSPSLGYIVRCPNCKTQMIKTVKVDKYGDRTIVWVCPVCGLESREYIA
uniref:Uncharacterized protein n=1 Tax=viral metagenome TaxID=1070528 RepID=A0A6M3LTP0_9ZZZZ